MTPPPSLQDLIETVTEDAGSPDTLLQLAQATRAAGDLESAADALLDHFVEGCRRDGRSWSEISAVLGVSKQAAHKRFVVVDRSTYERFTDRARAVLDLATEEAARLGHAYLGTEHLLLALFDASGSRAARVLESLGATRSLAEEQILERAKRGSAAGAGARPLTVKAVRALREAAAEALDLGNEAIGTEHVLLSLSREGQALASSVLTSLGASHDKVKRRLLQLLENE